MGSQRRNNVHSFEGRRSFLRPQVLSRCIHHPVALIRKRPENARSCNDKHAASHCMTCSQPLQCCRVSRAFDFVLASNGPIAPLPGTTKRLPALEPHDKPNASTPYQEGKIPQIASVRLRAPSWAEKLYFRLLFGHSTRGSRFTHSLAAFLPPSSTVAPCHIVDRLYSVQVGTFHQSQ